MVKLYVQYGAGFCAPDEWLNFDSSMTLWFERIPFLGRFYTKNNRCFPSNVLFGDIVKGLPNVKENSCSGVYCSHVLEHLPYQDASTALTNSYKMLKSGGMFRIVVPDLEVTVQKYINGLKNADYKASYTFIKDTGLGKEVRARTLFELIKAAMGNSSHLWMWDQISLQQALRQTGFGNIRECKYNDSNDFMFKLVEEEDRFRDSIAFECIK
ncbi:MAG: methyltransferase domain-containing protein [Candidatus Berkelbacteria bacterium]|nr:methyltransferase domain-containing protein [Candidatus Berkelbacteria bacterium]